MNDIVNDILQHSGKQPGDGEQQITITSGPTDQAKVTIKIKVKGQAHAYELAFFNRETIDIIIETLCKHRDRAFPLRAECMRSHGI